MVRNSPHTHDLLLEEWTLPYSKERAYFPLTALRADKFWPPVARVRQRPCDRHLICTCPPIEAYQEAAE